MNFNRGANQFPRNVCDAETRNISDRWSIQALLVYETERSV